MDVVDKVTPECNVAVFIGGSGLSLEEMYTAISRNMLVIPIRLVTNLRVQRSHSYLLNSCEAMDLFGRDRTPSQRDGATDFRRTTNETATGSIGYAKNLAG